MVAASLTFLLLLFSSAAAQSSLCRPNCGTIPIHYPLSLDDGCGSPYFRHLLLCSPSSTLHLRTPSGTYPVSSISYSPDPHLIISDPFMWSCTSAPTTTAPPFSLDSSTHLTLSPKNDFLFLNCSPEAVLLDPKPQFCERYPDRCGSGCDTAGYLCRSPPHCPDAFRWGASSCCTYFPEGSESVRMMLRHCAAYASVYWREVGGYEQAAEYGVRVDFEVPVTTRCLQCQDPDGGGLCGFDVHTREFQCLCNQANTTSHCREDAIVTQHRAMAGVIIGTTVAVSISGLVSTGFLLWYIRKLRTNKVTCGVQSNENRMF